ncbi:hypothetical protein DFS33DRAFT_1457331 [Desarmillaria ectypa]|nr:hypothetical protein DFS33DRAFT_1457331 [Desarmillaria ectypa]
MKIDAPNMHEQKRKINLSLHTLTVGITPLHIHELPLGANNMHSGYLQESMTEDSNVLGALPRIRGRERLQEDMSLRDEIPFSKALHHSGSDHYHMKSAVHSRGDVGLSSYSAPRIFIGVNEGGIRVHAGMLVPFRERYYRSTIPRPSSQSIIGSRFIIFRLGRHWTDLEDKDGPAPHGKKDPAVAKIHFKVSPLSSVRTFDEDFEDTGDVDQFLISYRGSVYANTCSRDGNIGDSDFTLRASWSNEVLMIRDACETYDCLEVLFGEGTITANAVEGSEAGKAGACALEMKDLFTVWTNPKMYGG